MNDANVDIMLEIPSIHPFISNVELYLEVESIFIGPVEYKGQSKSFVPFAQLPTQDNDTSLDHANTHHANQPILPSTSEPTMERQVLVIDNIFGFSDCESISQYDKDTSANITADMNVNNEVLEKKNMRNMKSKKTPQSQSFAWNLDLELRKGLIFQDKAELKRAVQLFSIKRHKKYEVVEIKKIWSLGCKRHRESGCKWRLRAYQCKSHELFEITQYDAPHIYVYPRLSHDHPQLDSNLLAHEIESQVKVEPSITIVALNAKVKDKFSYDVSYKKMWHAKQKVITNVFDDWDISYRLRDSTVRVFGLFHRIFWAFSHSIEGFKYCRPIISIDATHLYGRYKGKMLIAMGVDANNQFLPLPFDVAEVESFDTVNEPSSRWQEPWAYHRICLRHICSNFNDKFHNKNLKILVIELEMHISYESLIP
ncbi:uncharacterized protein LOC111287669 [Durio zibethinus]|uniref:Uncharacterized protein LOC111287669 n=1 Tax=Durio zibethinus TaxID=66656 RepID=A0A6P5Y0Y6_DURZI|nr:uncharacterized protein LOC111287669 [Durio zibethinus]